MGLKCALIVYHLPGRTSPFIGSSLSVSLSSGIMKLNGAFNCPTFTTLNVIVVTSLTGQRSKSKYYGTEIISRGTVAIRGIVNVPFAQLNTMISF